MRNHGPFTIGQRRQGRRQGRRHGRGGRPHRAHLPPARRPVPIAQADIDSLYDRYQNVYGQTKQPVHHQEQRDDQAVRRPRGLVPHRQPGPVRRGDAAPGRRAVAGDRAASLGDAAARRRIVWKPVLTDSDAIRRAALEANADDRVHRRHRLDAHVLARPRCGSPASTRCARRCCTCTRRRTSSCRGTTIDMDFMNLNQAAHGDREFGYIQTRLGVARKTVVGHVSNPAVHGVDRHLGARGGRLGRDARADARPLRRQHAQRRGHRGRQDRGRAAVRRLGEHVGRQRPGRGRRRGRRRRRRRARRRVRGPVRRRARAAPGRRAARVPALRRPPGDRAALPARVAGAPRPSRRTSRTSATCASCPGLAVQRLMADGLRLRRRGRLEDRRSSSAPPR